MRRLGMGYIAGLCLGLLLAGCNNGVQGGADQPVAGSAAGSPQIASNQTASRQRRTDLTHPLQSFCSKCHAAPSPRLHTAAEWPVVVRRMEHHRMDARMPPIPDAGRKVLLAWLQSHAKP